MEDPPVEDPPVRPDPVDEELLIVDDALLADLIAEADALMAEEGLVLTLPEGFVLESGAHADLLAELLRFYEAAP